MNKKDLVSRGKQLSFLLRHDKNYKFDFFYSEINKIYRKCANFFEK